MAAYFVMAVQGGIVGKGLMVVILDLKTHIAVPSQGLMNDKYETLRDGETSAFLSVSPSRFDYLNCETANLDSEKAWRKNRD